MVKQVGKLYPARPMILPFASHDRLGRNWMAIFVLFLYPEGMLFFPIIPADHA
jgi:hypothetical protein